MRNYLHKCSTLRRNFRFALPLRFTYKIWDGKTYFREIYPCAVS